jgi:uncharacterized delta-60 repeat protein
MLLLLGQAAAAPGDLDPSFGSGGTVETRIGGTSFAQGLALQPDGKIVLGGSADPGGVAVARFNTDGSLDSGFGSGGIVTTGTFGSAYALAIQPDGKILAAGWVEGRVFSLVRYDANGGLDTGFGSGGIARGPYGDAYALAIQPDGKIVVAGTSPDLTTSYVDDFVVVRFDANGVLDAGFGTNGVVRTRIGYSSSASSVAVQPDGMIVLAGSGGESYPGEFALARYTPDGGLDAGFGSSGVLTGPAGTGSAVALQPDGKILAAGAVSGAMALARYKPDGSPDAAFGSAGAVRTEVGSVAGAKALALQPDGKIVLAGYGGGGGVFALARQQPDGSLDTSFGSDGTVTTAVGWSGTATGVALQPNGRILAGGYSWGGAQSPRFALARYLVTIPTTIEGDPMAVAYGHTLTVKGTVTQHEAGTTVRLLRRGCYQFSTTEAARVVTGPGGTWTVRIKPRSRTVFKAEVDGEKSAPLNVQVRPKVMLVKVSAHLFQARVRATRSLAGEIVALQRYQPSSGVWVDLRRVVLRRIAGRRANVVSGRTFRAPTRHGELVRLLFRQANVWDCYATAASRAVEG